MRKAYDPNAIRLASDPRELARHVDADAIVKCRVKWYKSKKDKVRHLSQHSQYYDKLQRNRDTKSWRDLDVRDFELEDDIAMIYWEAYSEGFYGEPFPSSDEKYICPKCGLKYLVSLKTLPLNCKKCGKQTPLGRLSEDKVMSR